MEVLPIKHVLLPPNAQDSPADSYVDFYVRISILRRNSTKQKKQNQKQSAHQNISYGTRAQLTIFTSLPSKKKVQQNLFVRHKCDDFAKKRKLPRERGDLCAFDNDVSTLTFY